MFDAIQFYIENSIEFATEGRKHCTKDSVQIVCPFCSGTFGYHLGYSLVYGIYNCWRCGRHSKTKVIKALLNVPWHIAKQIEKKYTRGARRNFNVQSSNSIYQTNLPPGTQSLSNLPRHIEYLKGRRYAANALGRDWNVQGVNHLGLGYKNRVIVPIAFDGRIVSFQGRDITGKQEAKYKACPKDQEAIHHKELLYGMDDVNTSSVILCEGILDVWRMGLGSVCTFGVSFTQKQLLLLSQFDFVNIMYDMDEAGRSAAKKLEYSLTALGTECRILDYDAHDPDSLKAREVRLLKEKMNLL